MRAFLCCGAALAALASGLLAQVPITQVAVTGQPAPGGGTFSAAPTTSTPVAPTINAQGVVAFLAPGPFGLYTRRLPGGPAEPVRLFGRPGAPLVNALPGEFWTPPYSPVLDTEGRVAAAVQISAHSRGLTLGTASANAVLARNNDPAPGGPYTFDTFDRPQLSTTGALAVHARLNATSHDAVYHATPGGPLRRLLGTGDAGPGQSGVRIQSVDPEPVINAAGTVAFSGFRERSSPEVPFDAPDAVYAGTPGDVRAVVLGNQAIGSGPHRFRRAVGRLALNDRGDLAFWARVNSGEVLDRDAIVAGTALGGPAGLRVVARDGDAAPGLAPGEVLGQRHSPTAFWFPAMNGRGDVAFFSAIRRPAPAPDVPASGIWIDRAGSLAMAARSGSLVDAATGLAVDQVSREQLAFNTRGDLAFQALLTGPGVTAANDRAILHWSEGAGLSAVVREGDLLPALGGQLKTVADLTMSIEASGGQDGRMAAMNELGQLAFTVTFTDGTWGVYAATVPGPATATICAAVLLGAGRRRSGRRGPAL